jgi:hypothetical protein
VGTLKEEVFFVPFPENVCDVIQWSELAFMVNPGVKMGVLTDARCVDADLDIGVGAVAWSMFVTCTINARRLLLTNTSTIKIVSMGCWPNQVKGAIRTLFILFDC